ncbi:MAG: hypothetical protein ABIG92_03645 [Candidatus Omnitrophota bacterium]
MRELVYKNLTSIDKKRRDLYISEIVERDGVKTITKRHSLYVIGKGSRVDKVCSASGVLDMPKNINKRHVFIFKKHDTIAKKDTFVCDVVGKFYAVVKDELYPITFKHSFEIDFLSTGKNKNGGDCLD